MNDEKIKKIRPPSYEVPGPGQQKTPLDRGYLELCDTLTNFFYNSLGGGDLKIPFVDGHHI